MPSLLRLIAISLCIVICLATHASAQTPVKVVVLGIAQDAGRPHVGCDKLCCQRAWLEPDLRRYATCLGIIDAESRQRWMVECTPDFAWQLNLLNQAAEPSKANRAGLDGILLTHAHIGHYAGLMFLGREALGADGVPVYAMPRMRKFLTENGPWSQLVALKNIELRSLSAATPVELNERIRVEPFVVPHRDEFSEAVGFKIVGPTSSMLFIPDIDKWERWGTAVESLIRLTDVALLDGTFFSVDELPHRNMSEIPHPFIVESLERFRSLDQGQRHKVHFIHLNHSNPAHDVSSAETAKIEATGMHVARHGMTFDL